MTTEFVCEMARDGTVCTVTFDRFQIDFGQHGRYLGKRRVDGGRGAVYIPDHMFAEARIAALNAFSSAYGSFRPMGRSNWKSHMDFTASPE